jgi:hypothetical protein
MKGGVKNKGYSIFVISNFFSLPVIGWFMGGIVTAISGFVIAFLIDHFFPTYKWELTWHDIDLALKNIYIYGNGRCQLCFFVGKRKVYIYRDEKGSDRNPIRMIVRIPCSEWKEFFEDGDFHQLVDKFKVTGMYTKSRGKKDYILLTNGEDNICREVLRFLFEKAVGGLHPDIYAESTVNSTKNIWVEHQDGETEKQKIRREERLKITAQHQKAEFQQKRYIDEARKEQQAEQKLRRKAREKKIKERRKQKHK